MIGRHEKNSNRFMFMFLDSLTDLSAVIPAGSVVARNGRLKVVGSQLCNQHGQPVQLKGMSTAGTSWSPEFINEACIQWLKDDWKIDILRLAVLVDHSPDWWKGYADDPETQKAYVKTAVEAAVKCGIYVIIDWHMYLFTGDPNAYLQESKEFFREMATLYGNYPNVIYEICNEPHDVTWAGSIKPYAEEIISTIRSVASDNVILIGTGTWSQDIHEAAEDLLSHDNLMYVCHFYAGSHGQPLRDRIDACLDREMPIFISEWGTSDYTGGDDGKIYLEETQRWLDFMDSRKLSWVNWQLSDKANHTTAILLPGGSPTGGWSDEDLTESGRFIRSVFRKSR